MKSIEEECSKSTEVPVARQRKYAELEIAFTAYKDRGVHNITANQPIIYNRVSL